MCKEPLELKEGVKFKSSDLLTWLEKAIKL